MEKHFVLIEKKDYQELIQKMDKVLTLLNPGNEEKEETSFLGSKKKDDTKSVHRFLTAKEAQEFLNLPERTFYRLVQDKRIPKYPIEGSKRYKQIDLENFIKNYTET